MTAGGGDFLAIASSPNLTRLHDEAQGLSRNWVKLTVLTELVNSQSSAFSQRLIAHCLRVIGAICQPGGITSGLAVNLPTRRHYCRGIPIRRTRS